MKKFFRSIISAMRRKRCYFVTFNSSVSGLGNCTLTDYPAFNIRRNEDLISKTVGGGRIVILSYKRISKKEHLLSVENDYAEKG